jgi:hypothetical protein
MVRVSFDQFLWLAEQEAKKLDSTAKPIYHSAHEQLFDAYITSTKAANETTDLHEPDRSIYLDWLAEEYRQQRVALAAMTFAALARTVVLHLKSLLNWVGGQFPIQFPVQGSSELDRIIAEYQSRFRITLEELPHFATVREVVLARNSALHGEGQPSDHYIKRTEARCLDDSGDLNFTPELLDTFVEELKLFIAEVGKRMSEITQRLKTT